jgi:manganese-dependent inorganic pyrophosphatase
VVDYLQRVLRLDATAFGREMFESTSDLSRVDAEEIVSRDAKVYEAGGGRTLCIAQVETVGQALDERRDELLRALEAVRERRDYALYALMVTDILARDTDLYVSGDTGPLEQAFGQPVSDGVLALPGVMSRKKQVAPRMLAAF